APDEPARRGGEGLARVAPRLRGRGGAGGLACFRDRAARGTPVLPRAEARVPLAARPVPRPADGGEHRTLARLVGVAPRARGRRDRMRAPAPAPLAGRPPAPRMDGALPRRAALLPLL